ncbi:hypothetical protein ACMHYK_03035 [Candidatus Enterenecus avicola]
MTENRRAIDTDELLQIIDEANGIYLSTLVEILQCNRVNLSKRLKVLEKNKFIRSIKADKTIYYTKKYDLKNVKSLENQAKFIHSKLFKKYLAYFSNISIQTSSQKEKNLCLSMILNIKKNLSTIKNERKNKVFQHRDSLFKKESDMKEFWEHLTSVSVQMNLRLKFVTNENLPDYTTENYDYTDILVISDDKLIAKIRNRLQAKNYNTVRKDKIRNDILIYNYKTDKLYFFIAEKSYTITYNQQSINDIFFFIQYFFLTDNDKTTLTATNDRETIKNWLSLHYKSSDNKKRYNTVNIRLENKNRKTLDSN